MNLTWHIVKKDLRAFRWPLGLWLLVIVAKLGVGMVLLTADGTESVEWFNRVSGLAMVLATFEYVSFVLAAAIVQEDLLVGTKAFWRTRPISGGRLLRAKAAFLVLVFGLLPLLLALPWWLGCGYGLREIGWAALETFAIQAGCVLLGLFCAVVTDGFGRFLIWTLMTLFAIPTLATTLAYYFTRGVSNAMMPTRFAVGAVIAVVGIVAVVVHQYLTRRTSRSIGIIGATGVALVLVGAFWTPWPWKPESRWYGQLTEREQALWAALPEPAGLSFTVKSVNLSIPRPAAKGGQLQVAYRVEGLTDSQALWPWASTYALWWPDGSTTKGGAGGGGIRLTDMGAAKALGVAMKFAPEGPSVDEVGTSAWLEPETVTRLAAERPAYLLKNHLQLFRFDSATVVPLQGAGRTWSGRMGERVAGTEKAGELLFVTVIRNYPSLWVDRFISRPSTVGNFTQYLLVNRARGFVDDGRHVEHRSTRIATVEVSWHTQSYRASKKAGGKRPLLEAINALDDAELMRVAFVEQARFVHEITIDPLVVEPASP